MRRLPLVLLLALAACDSAAPIDEDAPTTIDVLFVYTPAAAAAVGDVEAYLTRAVAETNGAYGNSGAHVRLRAVHAAEVTFPSVDRTSDLTALMDPCDHVLDTVHALRDQHAADVVVLASDRPDATINGALMATAETAFAVVHVLHLGAPHYALGHEIGHLQGARHSIESGVFDAPFRYGHARRTATWKTIMSTGPYPVIPHFANPDVAYDGVPTGTDSLQNVTRVFNETAAYVASFRGPQHPTDFTPPGTWPTVALDRACRSGT